MYSESTFGNPGLFDGAISRFVQKLRHSAIGKIDGSLMKSAIPFAVMALIAGPMIDYSRSFIAQQQLAHAVEDTAMTLSHFSNSGKTLAIMGAQSEDGIKKTILRHFRANYPESTMSAGVKVNLIMANGKINISATSTVPTIVMAYAGIDFMQVNTRSEIAIPASGIR